MSKLRPGLYIVNYHEVNWEASSLVRSIGYYHSPDVFESQVRQLAEHGSLVSLPAAIDQLRDGQSFKEPVFAFWFDDGFAGVRRYAFPILNQFGIAAAISICSRFALRTEMYWHCILSHLRHIDALRFVRSRLKPLGCAPHTSLAEWLQNNFSLDVICILRSVYEEKTTDEFRRQAAKLFDDEAGIGELARAGWLIANHTAAHYPVCCSPNCELIAEQYQECAPLVAEFNPGQQYLVVPFGCGEAPWQQRSLYQKLGLNGTMVCVGGRLNTPESFRRDQIIYRVKPDWNRSKTFPLASMFQ